jgi:hypothetical protein
MLKFRCERQGWLNKINIYAYSQGQDGTYLASSPMMTKVAEGDAFVEPTFSVAPHQAQTLMDELWTAGLRPSEGSGSAGSLAATERHLADMRALVFDKKSS